MITAHLAVIKNPFSTAVPTAKVPDGRSPTSLSTRWHVSNSASSLTGRFLFCLQPSPTCPLISATATSATVANYVYSAGPAEFALTVGAAPTTPATIIAPPALQPAEPSAISLNTTHAGTFPFDIVSGPVTIAGDRVDVQLATGPNSPEKWRLVSQGLRLTPINNAELNSGWFEAIRVPSSYNLQECAFVQTFAGTPPVVTSPSLATLDLRSFEDGIAFKQNWANYPGYISGKVRDLPRHVFYLQTIGDREYHNSIDNAQATVVGLSHSRLTDCAEPITGFMDTTFDSILIRINGVPSQNDSQIPSIHFHAVSNLEHIQQANSILKRFESRCASAEGLVKKTDVLINRDPKPSIIRMYKE